MKKKLSEFDYLLAVAPKNMQLGKCPKGFELQMIEISYDDDDGIHKTNILAFVHEGLAIHKCPWGWHITHIRSGKVIMRPKMKRRAVKATKTLTGLINWHLAESTLRKRKDECDAAIGRVRDG